MSAEPEVGDSAQVGLQNGSNGAEGPVRMIGFSASELGTPTWLPDDPTGWKKLTKANGPFNGAFVPLVLHAPALAERSIDAAEWAADLISSEKGSLLCVAPFAHGNSCPGGTLSARQWNHMAAMIERLDDVTKRFKLEIFIKDVVDGVAARDELGLNPKLAVSYALDSGNFLSEGFTPTLLVCPESESNRSGQPTHDEPTHDEPTHDEQRLD